MYKVLWSNYDIAPVQTCSPGCISVSLYLWMYLCIIPRDDATFSARCLERKLAVPLGMCVSPNLYSKLQRLLLLVYSTKKVSSATCVSFNLYHHWQWMRAPKYLFSKFIPDICHRLHRRCLWRQICHVEKGST